MTDAPERIWAWVDYDGNWDGTWLADSVSPLMWPASAAKRQPDAEYLRADLAPSWSSDMEAAPKDGTLHLRGLWVHSAETGKPLYWQVDAGGYDEGNFTGPHGDDFGWSADDYTHWMPLPAPPKGET